MAEGGDALFGLYGALLRIIFTGFRGRGNDAFAQGIGLLIIGGILGVSSFFVFWPVVIGSFYTLILDGVLVFSLVGSGIARIVIGLFTLRDDIESRSGPAASPVNYYVALPEEMPAGYCWQCGRQVRRDGLICLRCGATQPKGAQVRAMMSAPTLERGGDSGHWPQWQEEENEEEDPLRRLGPTPMDPGRFPGGGPYPPGGPFPGGGPRPPYPPPNMPYPGPGGPAFPLPFRPMRRPPPGGPFPGGPFPPNQLPSPRTIIPSCATGAVITTGAVLRQLSGTLQRRVPASAVALATFAEKL